MTKVAKRSLIAGGVLVAIVGGSVVAGLPQYLSNYVDMLQAMRAFGKANEAYGRKEYEEAIEFYGTASDNAPKDNALIQTTLAFFTASSHDLVHRTSRSSDPDTAMHLDEAEKGYEETISIVQGALADPMLDQETKDTIAVYERYSAEQLAGIYRGSSRDDMGKAEHYLRRLIELNPDQPARYYTLGELYEQYHDPEENPLMDKVLEAFEMPVQLNPEDPIGYRQVANLLNRHGRFDETMEWLGRARDVDESNPEGYYLVATYYWDKVYRDPDLNRNERRDYIDLGIDQLDQALDLNDEYVDALIYKNLLLREKAKVDTRNSSALIAEADEYRNRALALREAQQEAERAAAAAAAEAAATATTTEEPQP